MGPRHKWASHACKPFFISISPSPLPTPHGLGHGSREAFAQIHMASGLEGLQPRPAVFALPPPFQGAPSPASSGSNITAAHPSFAGPQHTLVLTPHLGIDPRPPARNAASPSGRRSPLLGPAASSFQLLVTEQPGGTRSCVLGTERPTGIR